MRLPRWQRTLNSWDSITRPEAISPGILQLAVPVQQVDSTVTLEDEAGTMNVICWSSLVDQYRRELMGASLLGVYGIWQCENNVRHLIAKRLVDLSYLLGELHSKSRDFH